MPFVGCRAFCCLASIQKWTIFLLFDFVFFNFSTIEKSHCCLGWKIYAHCFVCLCLFVDLPLYPLYKFFFLWMIFQRKTTLNPSISIHFQSIHIYLYGEREKESFSFHMRIQLLHWFRFISPSRLLLIFRRWWYCFVSSKIFFCFFIIIADWLQHKAYILCLSAVSCSFFRLHSIIECKCQTKSHLVFATPLSTPLTSLPANKFNIKYISFTKFIYISFNVINTIVVDDDVANLKQSKAAMRRRKMNKWVPTQKKNENWQQTVVHFYPFFVLSSFLFYMQKENFVFVLWFRISSNSNIEYRLNVVINIIFVYVAFVVVMLRAATIFIWMAYLNFLNIENVSWCRTTEHLLCMKEWQRHSTEYTSVIVRCFYNTAYIFNNFIATIFIYQCMQCTSSL